MLASGVVRIAFRIVVNPHPVYPQIMVGINDRMRDEYLYYFAFLGGISQALSFFLSNSV